MMSDNFDRIQQLEKQNATLLNTLSGVMHFIDKWLDNATPYDPDADPDGDIAVNRAAEARKIALRAIEEAEWRNIQWNATAAHNPKGGIGCHYDKPYPSGGEPVPRCEIIT